MLTETHNLLDNLGRGVEVDQTLVDLEFVTIPGFRTLTTGLIKGFYLSRRNV
jgi:hypothetical protein